MILSIRFSVHAHRHGEPLRRAAICYRELPDPPIQQSWFRGSMTTERLARLNAAGPGN